MTRAPSESFTRTLQTAVDAWRPRAAPQWRVGLDGPLTARVTFATYADLESFCLVCAEVKNFSQALRETAASDPVEQEQGGLPI